MTTHSGIALIGASALFMATIEILQRHCWRRQIIGSIVGFLCFVVLAMLPCPPTHSTTALHTAPPPTLDQRPDLGGTEKLLIANYRRIRMERELSNARP